MNKYTIHLTYVLDIEAKSEEEAFSLIGEKMFDGWSEYDDREVVFVEPINE